MTAMNHNITLETFPITSDTRRFPNILHPFETLEREQHQKFQSKAIKELIFAIFS